MKVIRYLNEWMNEPVSEWMKARKTWKLLKKNYDNKRVKIKERKWIMKTEWVNEWMWERQGNEWISEWKLSTQDI